MNENRCYNCKYYSSCTEVCMNTGKRRSRVAYACESFERDQAGHCIICCRKLPMGEFVCRDCSSRREAK